MSTANKLREIADKLDRGDKDDTTREGLVELSATLQSLATTRVEQQAAKKVMLRGEWDKLPPMAQSEYLKVGGVLVD